MLTWAHVVDTTCPPFTAPTLSGRKSKVRKPDGGTTVPAKDIFRFEVPVKDAERMAMGNCSRKLRKYLGDETSSSQIDLSVQDKCK